MLLFNRLLGDLRRQVARDDHNAFSIADQNVTWINGDAPAGDRYVKIKSVMMDQVGRWRGAGTVNRPVHSPDCRCVAQAPVCYHAGNTTNLHAREQYGPSGCGPTIATAVHYQHTSCRYVLHGFSLRVLAILEDAQVIEIFPAGMYLRV